MGKSRMAVIAIVGLLLSWALALSADEKDKPPSIFWVVSKDSSEVISGDCRPSGGIPDDVLLSGKPEAYQRFIQSVRAVSCDFLDVRINPPDQKRAAEAGAAFSHSLEKPVEKPDEAALQKAFRKLEADPQTGPKTKEFFRNWMDAEARGDQKRLGQVFADKERRTCSIYVQHFTAQLKKIGEGVWLSDATPGGLCNVVSTLRLEFGDKPGGWQLSQTYIAVGGPKGNPICRDLRKVVGTPPEVFTWADAAKEAELTCDFLSWVSPSLFLSQ